MPVMGFLLQVELVCNPTLVYFLYFNKSYTDFYTILQLVYSSKELVKLITVISLATAIILIHMRNHAEENINTAE